MIKKTYTETITRERPCLVITPDEGAERDSPREWSNLGYFITVDRNYHSPDRHPMFEGIVKRTGDVAQSQSEHIDLIKAEIEETGETVVAIYPIVKYEHGNVCYELGTKHDFDYSNNGFYIITDKTAKESGLDEAMYKDVIRGELKTFTSYVNGEVYAYSLYNDKGEYIDGCGGFYSLEELREALPEEYKDEDLSDYLKY